MPRTSLLFSLCAMLAVCALPLRLVAQPNPTPPTALADAIDTTLAHDDFNGSFWGVVVVNLTSGYTLYQRHPNALFTLASNTKLFTASAVLEQLGPEYRYRTTMYTDGSVRDSVLYGNLVVQGSGDPSLGGPEYDDDPTAIFRAWADSLRAAGINRVTGDIIGDDDIFTDTPLGYGWSWDDTPYDYAPELGGLVFNENTVDVTIESRLVGMPGRVRWKPLNTDYVTIVNETMTIAASEDDDEEYERPLGQNTIYLRTRLPQGTTEEESLTVSNPTRYFVHVLRQVLQQQGIQVDGAPVDGDDLRHPPNYNTSAMRPVATYTSVPLADLVQEMNRESNNLYAEQLLRTLGVEHPVDSTDADAGSAEMGIESAMRTYAQAQIDTSRVQFADGSGLSRHNLVPPTAIIQLLTYMWDHPDDAVRAAFRTSLPQGGRNGTLEYRFRGSNTARERVQAKTGTLSNASALSGYVRSADGTPLAFSIICNHHLAKARVVRAAQDRIVNALANGTPRTVPE